MATDVVRADLAEEMATTWRSYPRSWLNVLIAAIERAPGSLWLTYLVIAAVMVAGSILYTTLAGLGTEGLQGSVIQAAWGILTVGLVAAVHGFDRLAQSAFDAVRPLLAADETEAARLRYELTVIPGRPAAAILVAAVPLTLMSYAADPIGSGVGGVPPLALTFRAINESFVTAVFLVLIYQTIRQLRCVDRIARRIERIDLFHPGPLYGFSRLTAAIGTVFIGFTLVGVVLSPSTYVDNPFYLAWLVVFLGFPVAIFVVPLYGLHRRLQGEKERIQVEADERLKGILAELNRDVELLDFSRADGLNKTLASLLQQRDVLARLPTWPWSTGTLRGFVTAVMLPLALFAVQRLVGQLL